MLDRVVRRGRARQAKMIVPQIGVDEKAFRRGHIDAAVVCDAERGTVEYVADDRGQASWAGYYVRPVTQSNI